MVRFQRKDRHVCISRLSPKFYDIDSADALPLQGWRGIFVLSPRRRRAPTAVRYHCTRRDCAGLREGKQHHCRGFKMSFNCRELLLAFARTARRVRHILTPGAVGGHRTGALQKARTAPYSSRRHKITVLWTVRIQHALGWMSAALGNFEDKENGKDLVLHGA